MIFKKDSSGFRTIIDHDTRITGDIQLGGDALLDGYLNGNIEATGNDSRLNICEHGRVEGSVVVPNLRVDGTIEGRISVTGRLEIGSKALIIGDIQYNLIEVSVGAQLDGQLIHKSKSLTANSDGELRVVAGGLPAYSQS